MRSRVAGIVTAGILTAGIVAAELLFATPLFAQSTPAQDGAATKSEKTAKAASSEPAPPHDLSGVWNMHATPAQRKFINSTWTAEGPTMTAWEQARYEQTKPSNGPRTHNLQETDDPVLKSCLPPGVPRIYLFNFPVQIVQIPGQVLMLFEYDHFVRRIYTDGRPHDSEQGPLWMGDSIGKWEGDTLVVDTTNFNDKTFIDRVGRPHSDALHLVERMRRIDPNSLEIAFTIDDPKAYTKPWGAKLIFENKPTWKVLEQICEDNASFIGLNEKATQPLKKKK